MKKTLMTSMLLGAMVIAGTLISNSADAVCPAKAPCDQKCEKPAPADFHRPMSPEERAKFREQKKAEFEERLKLTESQKAQLEKIKADEKKALKPYKEKIKKEHEKIRSLMDEEREIRAESMEKFEATLSAEQKAELEKIKQEMKAEMEKMGPRHPLAHPMPPKEGEPPMCPPECGCKCHHPEQAEPADCNCPCHREPVKK